jgi:hypothetical protein
VFDGLGALLPLILALVPLAAPAPGWLGVDLAPLVALALTEQLGDPCRPGMVLVDGSYCPTYQYQCQRFIKADESDRAERCAEYARRGTCPLVLEPRRFCIDRYEWPNLVGENPRVYVSWFEAKGLCSAVGKRLCRRTEWMLSCEGQKRLPYPYGFVRQPSPCNIDRGPVPFNDEAMQNPETREAELTRLWQADPLGSHPGCASPFGVYDMSGNPRYFDPQWGVLGAGTGHLPPHDLGPRAVFSLLSGGISLLFGHRRRHRDAAHRPPPRGFTLKRPHRAMVRIAPFPSTGSSTRFSRRGRHGRRHLLLESRMPRRPVCPGL